MLHHLSSEYPTITQRMYRENVYISSEVRELIRPSIEGNVLYMRSRKPGQPWQWQGVIYYLLIASQLPKYRIRSFDSGSDTVHSNGTHASHLFRAIIKAPAHRDLLHLHVFCLTRRQIGSVGPDGSPDGSDSSNDVSTESVVISLQSENP